MKRVSPLKIQSHIHPENQRIITCPQKSHNRLLLRDHSTPIAHYMPLQKSKPLSLSLSLSHRHQMGVSARERVRERERGGELDHTRAQKRFPSVHTRLLTGVVTRLARSLRCRLPRERESTCARARNSIELSLGRKSIASKLVNARARARMCVCVCVCARARACVCVR